MVDNFEERMNKEIKDLLIYAANFKHNFYGAAYSTRLEQAIPFMEKAIENAKQLLRDNGVKI